MQYVELNPFSRPEFPEEGRQPISLDQVKSLQRCASNAWQYYVQYKLEGKVSIRLLFC